MPRIYKRNCNWCKKYYKGVGVNFCSTICYQKWSDITIGHALFKGHKHSLETRKRFSEERAGEKHPLFGKHPSKKTIEKIRKGNLGKKNPKISGENHYNWIKDRTQLRKLDSHLGSAYKEWRKEVYKRDKWVCRMKNKDCSGKKEAHHILSYRDYSELRYEVNNGITLCHFHHPRKWEKEKILAPTFQELISQTNQ